jgi:hypothetical protein
MMGDGIIDIRKILGWVEEAGFRGFSEVEIFSARNWWHGQGMRCSQPALNVITQLCSGRHRAFGSMRVSSTAVRSLLVPIFPGPRSQVGVDRIRIFLTH